MTFEVEESKYNILSLTRRLGYHPERNKSYSRRLGQDDFPRFHIYINKIKKGFKFSLHLDQKETCYQNQTAHSGDYDGQVLEDEKTRILNLLKD